MAAANATEAETNAVQAEANAIAESEARAVADANATAEAAARQDAEAQRRLAVAREMAASSVGVLDDDPELAVLLGLQAIRLAPESDEPPLESRIALRQAIQASLLVDRIDIGDVDEGIFLAEMSPNANQLALVESSTVRLLNIDERLTEWTWGAGDLERPDGGVGLLCPSGAVFSATGDKVFIGLADVVTGGCSTPGESGGSPTSALAAVDTATGVLDRVRFLGDCPEMFIGPVSPTEGLVPVVTPADGNCDPGTPLDWTITLLDPEDLSPVRSIPVPDIGTVSWSADGSRVAIGAYFGWGAIIYDSQSGAVISEVQSPEGLFFGELNPDGTRVATSNLESALVISETTTGSQVDRLPDLQTGPVAITWTPDGSRVLAGGRGDRAAIWHSTTGAVETLIPNTGVTVGIEFRQAAEQLVQIGLDSVSLWDVSGTVAGTSSSVSVGDDALMQAQSVTASSSMGAFLFRQDDWYVGTFAPESGKLLPFSLATAMGRATSVFDDGRIVVFLREDLEDDQLIGPLVTWQPETGEIETILGCSALLSELVAAEDQARTAACVNGAAYFDFDRALLSPDGSILAITSQDRQILFVDPMSTEVLETVELPEGEETIRAVGPNWIATSDTATGVTTPARQISLYTVPDFEHLVTLNGQWAEASPDGSLLTVTTGAGEITLVDTSSGEIAGVLSEGTARIRGLAFSPDGAYFMSAGTDSFMRIWDLDTYREVDRVPLPEGGFGAGDGYWVDEQTIAINYASGFWATVEIGIDPLLEIARSRLLRTFTDQECLTYRIDPCPSLEELRGG